MHNYFYSLADFVEQQLQSEEVSLTRFRGEQSDFIRFNQAKVRQPSSVIQRYLEIDLIQAQRHTHGQLTLSGQLSTDKARITQLILELRQQLPELSEDPYLLYATEVNVSEVIATCHLPKAKEVLGEILGAVAGYDFVGLYAAGGIFSGFANSFGQRNWHSSYNFSLDWSFYHHQDKAVKAAYAGSQWETSVFHDKIQQCQAQFEIIQRSPRTIEPGRYRVYLAPSALYEIFKLLSWGSFGLKFQRTKESPLLKMLAEPRQDLHPSITLRENTAAGLAPAFQSEGGFIKPDQVLLIENGIYRDALVSPRSAKEYDVPTNGANAEETPTALDLAAGSFSQAEVLKTLGNGIYINNLWYLNYSDRAACRITGMTRFATFWVEQGEIIAPLNVMRFDETLYQLLGSKLIALTAEREFMIETDTYEFRSTNSARLPGALIDEFTFTL